MKAFFARNLIAAFALFALAVLLDYAHIKVASPAAENFVVVPLAFLAIVAPPVTFWIVNEKTFADKRYALWLRVFLSVGLSVLYGVVVFIPLVWFHEALGGEM